MEGHHGEHDIHETEETSPSAPSCCVGCGKPLGDSSIVCGVCGAPNAVLVERRAEFEQRSSKGCLHDYRYIPGQQKKVCISCAKVVPLKTPAERRKYASALGEEICIYCGAMKVDGHIICEECGKQYVEITPLPKKDYKAKTSLNITKTVQTTQPRLKHLFGRLGLGKRAKIKLSPLLLIGVVLFAVGVILLITGLRAGSPNSSAFPYEYIPSGTGIEETAEFQDAEQYWSAYWQKRTGAPTPSEVAQSYARDQLDPEYRKQVTAGWSGAPYLLVLSVIMMVSGIGVVGVKLVIDNKSQTPSIPEYDENSEQVRWR